MISRTVHGTRLTRVIKELDFFPRENHNTLFGSYALWRNKY